VTVLKQVRKTLTALLLVLVLSVVTACSAGAPTAKQPNLISPSVTSSHNYAQLERGNTTTGENFGNWVVRNAKGLIQDAYVRDNDKLGVVISPEVRPNEVRDLARSLTQGFHQSFPGRNLKVLVYAQDRQLILTADYDVQSQQIQYKAG
jgi:hypothetical protein